MFRREWRQQLLVVTLLTVAVAAAVGSITIVYNTSPRGRRRVRLGQRPARVRRLRSAKAPGGARRRRRSRSGRSTSSATARWPSPAASRRWTSGRRTRGGAYGGELLALRSGSYPAGPGEVAVTDGVAELSAARDRVDAGARRSAADGRRHRREPAQAERRVRARLALVRGARSTVDGPGRRERRRRSTPSCGPG